ncbi:MAG: hypothetical protein QOG42_2143 [Solirubrobacteraceae bacterium]|jgi:hypothetical protein|nr:hypothetical protein [Solirubrobacteraceae bacterium]
MSSVRVYKGEQILAVGMPLVIAAVSDVEHSWRRCEYYRLILPLPGGAVFRRKFFEFSGYADTIFSEKSCHEILLAEAEVDLEKFLQARRAHLGTEVLPHGRYFTPLTEVEPSMILYYTVRRKLFGLFTDIRDETRVKELEDLLTIFRQAKLGGIEESSEQDREI